jgi:hypothetical protein
MENAYVPCMRDNRGAGRGRQLVQRWNVGARREGISRPASLAGQAMATHCRNDQAARLMSSATCRRMRSNVSTDWPP